MAERAWSLETCLDLYKVEFERTDQITSNLHAQWGYLTILATAVWLLAKDAASLSPPLPALVWTELGFAVGGFVLLGFAARLLLRVHISDARLMRLGPLGKFEEFHKGVDEVEGIERSPAVALEDALCEKLRSARDETAVSNKKRNDQLWRARGFKAGALGAVVVMGLLELARALMR